LPVLSLLFTFVSFAILVERSWELWVFSPIGTTYRDEIKFYNCTCPSTTPEVAVATAAAAKIVVATSNMQQQQQQDGRREIK